MGGKLKIYLTLQEDNRIPVAVLANFDENVDN